LDDHFSVERVIDVLLGRMSSTALL